MTLVRDTDLQRPSTWWLVVAAAFVALAVAAIVTAVVNQRSATKLIGEGEVFSTDVSASVEILGSGDQPQEAVRRARNELEVEAVSLVDDSGTVAISTSPTLVGQTLENPMLIYGASEGRFTAIAGGTDTEIELDGVLEWPEGSILYQVLSPLPDSNESLLIHYDLSEMLARRARSSGLQPETLQLLGLGLLFAVLTGVVLVGHGRVNRRHRELKLESDLLITHSRELESKNVELEEARARAERALALAEEKMRIRSDFILMINHELRTPLTSVVTGAELLNDAPVARAEDQIVLDAIVHDGRRLLEMIDQILAVARIENLGLNFNLEAVSVDELIEGIEKAQAVTLTPSASPVDPATRVKTDLKTLTMVIASLSDNARTHGATQVEIVCDAEPVRADVEVGHRPNSAIFIRVSDNGPGIDPEFLPRVFEKFEKASFSSGTGLGLYVARMMVEAIEGSIAVTSSDRGTTFQLAIPVVPVKMAVGT